jgi:hypothetical protein
MIVLLLSSTSCWCLSCLWKAGTTDQTPRVWLGKGHTPAVRLLAPLIRHACQHHGRQVAASDSVGGAYVPLGSGVAGGGVLGTLTLNIAAVGLQECAQRAVPG